MTRINSMDLAVDEAMTLEPDFLEIYQSHYHRVFNLCCYLLNSRDAAEDATQEVFLKVERGLDTYDRTRSLTT